MSSLKELKKLINRRTGYRFCDDLDKLYLNDFDTLTKLLSKASDLQVETFIEEDEDKQVNAIRVTNKLKSEFVIRFNDEGEVC